MVLVGEGQVTVFFMAVVSASGGCTQLGQRRPTEARALHRANREHGREGSLRQPGVSTAGWSLETKRTKS